MDIGSGKVAVVTGAGSGIGLAMANAFAAAGCAVVLADVQVDALEAAAAEVGAHDGEVLTVVTDVSKADQVEALAAATIERFGAVHIVCNNAGVTPAGDSWVGPIENWEWVMGVNFWGVIYGIRSFLPHIVASGGGHIVNTASILGVLPAFGGPYDASKHAVVAVTEGLYHSLNSAGLPIGVSCLCPGWVRTGIIDADRNWPVELGELPTRDAAAEISAGYVRRAIEEGAQPGAVADLVLESIRSSRFWVFPSPEFLDVAIERFHTIADGLDPVPAENIPGLPPRSQMMDEVMRAMLPDTAPADTTSE